MKNLLLILLTTIPTALFAQFQSGGYTELKYDNFRGPDADVFQTEVQGFGSINFNEGGYIGYSFGKGLIKPHLYLNMGVTNKIYRFKNDYVFTRQNGQLEFLPDDASHEYTSNFFGYSKSKLNNYYIRLNPEFGFTLFDAVLISGGPVLDFRYYIYSRNKYKMDEYRYNDEQRRNNHFKTPFMHFGWKVNFGTRWFGVFATYMTTPFFKESDAPQIYPITFGIYTRYSDDD